MKKRPPLFTCVEITAETTAISLQGEEAIHAMKSRRLRTDDKIRLTNGKGLTVTGIITRSNPKPTTLQVAITGAVETPPPAIKVKLAAALPKGDRLQNLLEMAVQLGITEFIPLECDRSVTLYREKSRPRWQRIIESACKQCEQPHFPVITSPTTPEELIQDSTGQSIALYGDANGRSISKVMKGIIHPVDQFTILVGPEGGFSDSELSKFKHQPSIKGVTVGSLILRTETACAALLASLHPYI